MAFSIGDLFVAGLGLDAAGAVLLAKGLLIHPAALGKVSGNTMQASCSESRDREGP